MAEDEWDVEKGLQTSCSEPLSTDALRAAAAGSFIRRVQTQQRRQGLQPGPSCAAQGIDDWHDGAGQAGGAPVQHPQQLLGTQEEAPRPWEVSHSLVTQ